LKAIDIILSILLLIGLVSGFRRGLVLEIISLISLLIGIIGAIKLQTYGVDLLTPYAEGFEGAIPVIVFILIFILLVFAIRTVGRVIKSVMDKTIFGALDNYLGAIFGLLKWAFMISVLIMFYEYFGGKFKYSTIGESIIFPYVVMIAPFVLELIAILFPFIMEWTESIKDERMNSKDFVVNLIK